MGILSKFKLQYTGALPTKTFGSSWTPEGRAAATSEKLASFYDSTGIIRAILDLIGRPQAQIYWRLFERTNQEGRSIQSRQLNQAGYETRKMELGRLKQRGKLKEIDQHPLLDLLADPCRQLTAFAFWMLASHSIESTGNFFAVIERDQLGMPLYLTPIPSHCVTRLPSAQNPGFFEIHYENFKGPVREADVWWHKNPSPSRPLGLGSSVAGAVFDEIAALESTGIAIRSAMKRAGHPIAIVGVEGTYGPGQTGSEALANQLSNHHSSPHDAGKPMIVSGKVTWTPTVVDLKSLDAAALSAQLTNQILQQWGVSPELLGQMQGGADRARSEAARFIFLDTVIFPRATSLRQSLQADLVSQFDSTGTLILEMDDMRPADAARFQPYALSGVTAPVILKNEVRVYAGLEPLPELDGQFVALMPGQKSSDQPTAPAPTPSPQSSGTDES